MEEPEEPPPEVSEIAKTPPGARSGSKEALQSKVRALTEALEMERKRGFSPAEMQLLEPAKLAPKKQKPVRSGHRLNAKSGSMAMNDILGDSKEQEADPKKQADATAARKEAAAAKKEAEAAALAELEAKFMRCQDGCKCETTPCQVAGLKRCPTCQKIKKGDCRVQACKDARAPLLLTCSEEAAAAAAEPLALTHEQ